MVGLQNSLLSYSYQKEYAYIIMVIRYPLSVSGIRIRYPRFRPSLKFLVATAFRQLFLEKHQKNPYFKLHTSTRYNFDMFSWQFCVLFAVVFYSRSSMSCTYNSDCFGSQKCCSNNLCRSDCSDGLSSVVVIIIVILAVVGKIVFWVVCCYCWRRRQTPGIIIHTVNTPRNVVMAGATQMSSTASQGYPTHSQSYTNSYPSQGATDPTVGPPPPYKEDSYP